MNRESSSDRTFVDLACVFVVGVVLGSTPSARGHSVSTFYPNKWASDPIYALGATSTPLNTTTAMSSMRSGAGRASLALGWTSTGPVWTIRMSYGLAVRAPPFRTGGRVGFSVIISPLVTNGCLSGSTVVKATIRHDHTRSCSGPAE